MRRGVFIMRGEKASIRRQSQACLVLSERGWTTGAKTRFDGVLIVSMDRNDGEPDGNLEEVLALLKEEEIYFDNDSELREIPPAN